MENPLDIERKEQSRPSASHRTTAKCCWLLLWPARCNLLLCVPGTGPRQSRRQRSSGALGSGHSLHSAAEECQRLEMFYHRKLFYYATQFLGTASPPQPPPCHWATLAQKDVHKLQTITTTVRTQDPPPAPRHKVLLLRYGNRMGKSKILKATNIL